MEHKKSVEVMFYHNEIAFKNRFSCLAIYALQVMEDAFLWKERNPVTMNVKNTVAKIPFKNMIRMDVSMEIRALSDTLLPIPHIYEQDPTGYFFDEWTYIKMKITCLEEKTYSFSFGDIRQTLPIIVQIAQQEKIQLFMTPIAMAQDVLAQRDPKKLYAAYILPTLTQEPYIKGWKD